MTVDEAVDEAVDAINGVIDSGRVSDSDVPLLASLFPDLDLLAFLLPGESVEGAA
jgi:hypothetical protein